MKCGLSGMLQQTAIESALLVARDILRGTDIHDLVSDASIPAIVATTACDNLSEDWKRLLTTDATVFSIATGLRYLLYQSVMNNTRASSLDVNRMRRVEAYAILLLSIAGKRESHADIGFIAIAYAALVSSLYAEYPGRLLESSLFLLAIKAANEAETVVKFSASMLLEQAIVVNIRNFSLLTMDHNEERASTPSHVPWFFTTACKNLFTRAFSLERVSGDDLVELHSQLRAAIARFGIYDTAGGTDEPP